MPRHDPVPRRSAAPPALANPHAWARYRRIMRWMALLSALCAAGALLWLHETGVPMRLHMVIATTLGIFLTVLVGTGLMSLVFLSAGSGHDAQAGERFEE
jgi:hypothetical protein